MIMDNQITITIISTAGAVITGIFGMWITGHGIHKRMDSLEKSIDNRFNDFSRRIDRLEDRFNTFQDIVNGKFKDLDREIGKLLDRPK